MSGVDATVDAGASGAQRVPGMVSVVVPTKEVAGPLAPCLASIKAQTYTPIELIVVDNGSTDGTVAVAEQHADLVLHAGPERSAQRNLGIERSRGDWILWIDADMVLPPTLIAAMIAAGEADGAIGVFALEETTGEGFWAACRRLERSCYWDEVSVQSPRLVRASWFAEHGGFSTALSGTEDADLRNRMVASGGPMTSVPDMIIHEEGRLSLPVLCRKRYYYGKSLPAFRRLQPGAMSQQAGATVSAYVRGWRRLLREPLHALGLVVMRAVELGAYAVGALVGEIEIRRHGMPTPTESTTSAT